MEDASLSPDGRYVAVSNFDRPTKSSVVMLVPVAGGKPIELIRETLPVFWGQLTWAPDGHGLIAMKLWSESVGTGRYGKIELWLVPVGGGQPRKLEIDAPNIVEAPVRMHPDGRQIAFIAGAQKAEVWVLENFLPALRSKR